MFLFHRPDNSSWACIDNELQTMTITTTKGIPALPGDFAIACGIRIKQTEYIIQHKKN